MNVARIARRAFDERLAALGFQHVPGQGAVWSRERPGQPVVMVEVEKERMFDRFHVILRRRAAADEMFHVAEAAGLRWYEYSTHEELEAAVIAARSHFEQWGVPWLAGERIGSPALAAIQRSVDAQLFTRHEAEAQVAFREGRFADVLTSVAAAERHGELSEVSRRYRTLARKRLEGGT